MYALHLSVIREVSQKFQNEIVKKRQEENTLVPTYLPGDFILWNSLENPCDHLDEKLATPWKGPYEVVKQIKNDIECTHIVLGEDAVLHVSRVKPFFGSREDAIRVAMNDKDQMGIVSIDWSTGNPHIRTSMVFGITWADGFQSIRYNADLAAAQQFKDYAHSRPDLLPLRYTRDQANKEIRRINTNTIDSVSLDQYIYLNLRYFDGSTSVWYDNLSLPHPEKTYVTKGKVVSWVNQGRNRVKIRVDIFKASYTLTTYELQAYVTDQFRQECMVDVTSTAREVWPQIWAN